MGGRPKYSKEIKIKACKDYENGRTSFYIIADEIGTTKEVVRRWYLRYKEHGSSVLKHQAKMTHIARNLSCQ